MALFAACVAVAAIAVTPPSWVGLAADMKSIGTSPPEYSRSCKYLASKIIAKERMFC